MYLFEKKRYEPDQKNVDADTKCASVISLCLNNGSHSYNYTVNAFEALIKSCRLTTLHEMHAEVRQRGPINTF